MKNSEYHTKLLVYKERRFGLFVLLFVFFFIFTIVLFTNLMSGIHWLAFAGPICLLGGIVMVLPPTEEWVYVPWQSNAQQYERHLTD
jgi:hypothetical protein